jgi:hypothetical protein
MSYNSIANRKWFHSGKTLLFRSQSPIFIHPFEDHSVGRVSLTPVRMDADGLQVNEQGGNPLRVSIFLRAFS